MGPTSMLRVAVLGLGCVLGCAESHRVDAALPVDSGVDAGRRHMDAGLRCGADEFVWNSVCRPCPSGSTNEAGDDPTGPNTQCDDACTAIDGIACSTYLKGNIPTVSNGFGDNIEAEGDVMVISDRSVGGAGRPVGTFTFERRGPSWELVDHSESITGRVRLGGPEHLLLRNTVYRRAGSGWEQEATLDAEIIDWFGAADWDISGDTAVLGVPREASGGRGIGIRRTGNAPRSGAVVVFRLIDGVWTLETIIKASDSVAEMRFGDKVLIEGNTLAISTRQQRTYMFHRGPGGWTEEAHIEGNPWGMAIDDGVAVLVDHVPEWPTARVYERHDGAWTQQHELQAQPAGQGVATRVAAIDGNLIVIGSVDFLDGTGLDPQGSQYLFGAGAAHVYERQGDRWEFLHTVKPDVNEEGDQYGRAVAVSGNTIMVGAPADDGDGQLFSGDPYDNSAENSGAVWLRRFPHLAPRG